MEKKERKKNLIRAEGEMKNSAAAQLFFSNAPTRFNPEK